MSNSFSWNNVNYIIGKKNFSVRWNPFRVVKEMNTRKVLDNGNHHGYNQYRRLSFNIYTSFQ